MGCVGRECCHTLLNDPGGTVQALKTTIGILVISMLGCGLGEITISITPRTATMYTNEKFQFQASVGSAGNKAVAWSSVGGTVTEQGLFTAPEAPGTCHVIATSQADGSKTAVATVTVEAAVAVTPAAIRLIPGSTQEFTAKVLATGDTRFTWSIEEGPDGGLITDAGVFTAPPVNGTYHVKATSVADPAKVGFAVVTVVSSL
jgi:hypothetical protein